MTSMSAVASLPKSLLGSVIAAICGFALTARDAAAVRPDPRPTQSAVERAAFIADLREKFAQPRDAWPTPTIDAGVEWREFGPIPAVPDPADNPRTPPKIELGRMLFFDPRLSGSGQLACASCHEPDLAWSDGRAVSFGHNRTQLTRNAPSLLNAGLRASFFWDGRAASLEQQARDVLSNPDEMHSSEETLVEHLQLIPEYRRRFADVFGDEQVTMPRTAQALAAFERTIVGGSSRFDYFLNGKVNALKDDELAGLQLFRTQARCMNCHHGPLLTDDKFHNIGVSKYGRPFADLGRYQVTKDPADVGAFRTPSLRNLNKTGPYMHSGMFILDELVVLYNGGMPHPRRNDKQQDDPLFPTTSQLLKPLNFNEQDFTDLKAFLSTLSEPPRRVLPPKLPPMSDDVQ